MHNFILFCKTYRGDQSRFELLLESIKRYNAANIPFYVSVPQEDLEIFSQYAESGVILITDESYMQQYKTKEKHFGLSEGYVNQEICKLAFHEADYCNHYLCLDSDTQFIRPFTVDDFMYDENTPYTVLVMDKDLSIEKHYQYFWDYRANLIKKIYDEVGLNDRRFRTCHNSQVMSVKVLCSLKNDFMIPKGYTYEMLIAISPYEFTWYNAWFQKCQLVPEYAVEPFFRMFHHRIEYIFSLLKNLSLGDYSRAYVGIILNSNWEQKPIKQYRELHKIDKLIYKILRRV